MMLKSHEGPKLPKQQLTILGICRFAEPVAMTSVYPYIPEMVQSFNVPTEKVAKWAGLLSAVFSLSQSLTGIAWGRASDLFGRKPIILIALTCTMISGLLFGFSPSLPWAFASRSMQGLSNGNVGIIRTAVAEIVPERELQPLAFSLMPLVWTVGSIFGPALGGSLVYPVERFPAIFKNSKLFEDYPFALPNVLISVLFMVSIISGFLFLNESLESRKHKRDYGILLGQLLTSPCTGRSKQKMVWNERDEIDALVPADEDQVSGSKPKPGKQTRPARSRPAWSQVFSRQSNINLVVYTFLAAHSVAADQLLPVFMHHPVQSIDDPAVHLPLKFAGGFGLDSERIGLMFMAYGIYGMVIQFALFPTAAARFGVLNCLKACSLTFPLVYVAMPFCALLPTSAWRQGATAFLMMFKGCCSIFAFPCSTILMTNSANSLSILGTLNGVATSISAMGRAAGPASAGLFFSQGVQTGYVITSWWFLAVVAVIGAVPVWLLEEMPGFSSSSGGSESASEAEEQEEGEEGEGEGEDYTRADSAAHQGPQETKVSSQPGGSDDTAREHGEDDEDDEDDDDEATHLSKTVSLSSAWDRRDELDAQRVPSPIGFGVGLTGTRSRRYSTDLGATRSGFGPGGTSYY